MKQDAATVVPNVNTFSHLSRSSVEYPLSHEGESARFVGSWVASSSCSPIPLVEFGGDVVLLVGDTSPLPSLLEPTMSSISTGESFEAFFSSSSTFVTSWPQALAMSAPIVRRMVQNDPYDATISRNSRICFSEGHRSLSLTSVALYGIRLTTR